MNNSSFGYVLLILFAVGLPIFSTYESDAKQEIQAIAREINVR